jgi:formylglycine-generating enzyme required for sulfatase activity
MKILKAPESPVNRSLELVRRSFLFLSALAMLSAFTFGDEWKARHALVPPNGIMNLSQLPGPEEIFFSGPEDPAATAAWLERLKVWREDRLTRIRYEGSQFERPELEWTRHVFSQVQLLIWDRDFYDPEHSEYTVGRFLDETEKRIGPIDAVLIWHVYPNLGVDNRNQFDLLRDLPGGIPALRQVVNQFHSRGVRVFFPFIKWDQGTRDEGGSLSLAMAKLLNDIGADGINFDTLDSVPADFREAADAVGHPLALEPQFEPRDQSLSWTNVAWNDWVVWEGREYPFVPMVDKNRWLEARHTVAVTDRFTRDKTDSLQHAFFNGEGYAVLENLWGFFYAMNPNDAEALLRFTHIERAMSDNLHSQKWEPHTAMLQPGVFASKFPGKADILWLIVNRNEYAVTGDQLRLPSAKGMHYYDLWHGIELTPQVQGQEAILNFEMEGRGFGAVLASTVDATAGQTHDLIAYMSQRAKLPLASYSRQWHPVQQKTVEIRPTKAAQAAPAGMVRVPEVDYDFRVSGIEIEGGNDPGVDVQYPWEDIPRRFHDHRMHLRSFFIDRTPVTNAEFKEFLAKSNYHPKDDHNFLRDWKAQTYPTGWGNKPVTWVSIEDARAFAAWAGKRLPHEWEWQYAAQSTDGRPYPWGNEWKPDALPVADHSRTMRSPSSVDAFPQGASSFGVLDLVGNVSQWTDEYRDQHTRAAIIRGGAYYQPRSSIWYFPQAYRLDEHQKYLLMSPGRDRAGTIGFRCVVDAQ